MSNSLIASFIHQLTQKTIHIVGIAGAEGSTIAAFLLKEGLAGQMVAHDFIEEAQFHETYFYNHDWMSDAEKEASFQHLLESGMRFCFKERYLHDIAPGDIVFVPQSWFRYDFNEPLRRYFDDSHRLKDQYLEEVYSMTRLYLELFPGTIIGVTGTKGKSTTTALIGSILRKAHEGQNKRFYWGGNDRKNPQPLDDIHGSDENDTLLLEISNRQLVFGNRKSPHIALITNIIPSHLDDHGTFEHYLEAKYELVRYQTEHDFAILNQDDRYSLEASSVTKAGIIPYTLDESTDGAYIRDQWFCWKDQKILPIHDVPLLGKHNWSNVAGAIAAVKVWGLESNELIAAAIRSFRPLEHRLEYVATVNGVRWINDSAGSNSHNVSVAVHSVPEPKHLIIGGRRKDYQTGDFHEAAETILSTNVLSVWLIGQIRENIRNDLLAAGIDPARIHMVSDLAEAVQGAFALARPNEAVILAPGAESFGEFRDYRERGKRFKEFVLSLKENDEKM